MTGWTAEWMTVMDDAALRQRATELAIETFYWGADGVRHEADPEALRRVVEVVEADYSRSQALYPPDRARLAGARLRR